MLVINDSVSDENIDVFLDGLNERLTAFFDVAGVITTKSEEPQEVSVGKVSH